MNDTPFGEQSWSERNRQPRRGKPFDFDAWTESNTFTRFPSYETFLAIQHMTVEETISNLTSPIDGLRTLAVYKVCDVAMRLEKDECRLKRGLDRYHYKTEQEIKQAEHLSRVFKQLIQKAMGE